MIEINGFYYDGKTAARYAVSIRFYETGLVEIKADDFTVNSNLNSARISPRLANTCRSIYLDNNSKIETFANDELDKIEHYFNQNKGQAWVHKLEQKLFYVLIALVITLVTLWASINYGMPLLAKSLANNMPFSLEQTIGQQGFQALDKTVFQSSTVDEKIQHRLKKEFQQAIINLPYAQYYQLEFRQSKQLGANAFSLPSGIIIITDDLIKLADNDQQIIAVLAHEIGHVFYKHSLRSLLQNSFTVLFMAGVLGDVSSLSSLAVALPTILVETHYSRQFELQADDYAVAFLKTQQINPLVFTQILEHLQKTDTNTTNNVNYLSSHPAVDERIKRIYDANDLKQ